MVSAYGSKKIDNKGIVRSFNIENNPTFKRLIVLILASGVKDSPAFSAWKKFILRYLDKDIIQRNRDVTELEKAFDAELFELVFSIHVSTYQIVKRFAVLRTNPDNSSRFTADLFESAYRVDVEATLLIDELARELLAAGASQPSDVYELIETAYRAVVPKQLRKPLGEYYTPTNVSKLMVDEFAHKEGQLWMDNSAGLGSFLSSFLLQNGADKIYDFASIEINPLTQYLAKIIVVLSYPELSRDFEKLPIYWGDTILNQKYDYQNKAIQVVGDFADYFGRVDVVIGNPPWVAWKSITKEYQSLIGDDWRSYGIFEKNVSRRNLGACNDDMSSYFVYYSVDKFLKTGGQISYLINLTLFKSHLAGKHFRKFFIEKNKTYFRVERVEDFGDIKVFPNVSNTYCVFVAQKGPQTTYPIEYIKYVKKGLQMVKVSTTARPENNAAGGAFVTADDEKFNSSALEGTCRYKGRAGVCTWLNSVYWVHAERNGNVYDIRNLHSSGKKKVAEVVTQIEAENIYQLLRARNLRNFEPTIENHIIVPQDKDNLSKAISNEELSEKWPLTLNYFRNFEGALLDRSGYKKFLSNQPFYALYNIGPYTTADIKLCWQFISKKFRAYIINNAADIIPDLNVMFIPLESMSEAYYLYSILNSSQARHKIEASSNWTFPSGVIKRIKIDKFDPKDSVHSGLAKKQEQLLTAGKESDTELESLLLEYWA